YRDRRGTPQPNPRRCRTHRTSRLTARRCFDTTVEIWWSGRLCGSRRADGHYNLEARRPEPCSVLVRDRFEIIVDRAEARAVAFPVVLVVDRLPAVLTIFVRTVGIGEFSEYIAHRSAVTCRRDESAPGSGDDPRKRCD